MTANKFYDDIQKYTIVVHKTNLWTNDKGTSKHK